MSNFAKTTPLLLAIAGTIMPSAAPHDCDKEDKNLACTLPALHPEDMTDSEPQGPTIGPTIAAVGTPSNMPPGQRMFEMPWQRTDVDSIQTMLEGIRHRQRYSALWMASGSNPPA